MALSVSPLVWLGRISYGVYVYHWPLYLYLDHQRTGLGPLALTAVRLAATFGSHRVVRAGRTADPHRSVHTRPGAVDRSPRRARGHGNRGSAVAASATAPAIHFAPAAPLVIPAAPPKVSRSTSHETPPTASPDSPRRLLIVGDSVALTLGRGIERWGAARGMPVLNEGQLGCGLLNGAEVRGYWGVKTRDADPCHQQALWQKTIAKFRPDVVVVLFGVWDVYDSVVEWRQHLVRTGHTHVGRALRTRSGRDRRVLRASGDRVLWLEPPCFADTSPTDTSPPPWYSPSRRRGRRRNRTAGRRARDGEYATDVVHQSGCPVSLTMRPDGVHYSDPGADAVAPAVGRDPARLDREATRSMKLRLGASRPTVS